MSRILTFTGQGAYQGLFNSSGIGFNDTPEMIANHIASQLTANGWGVQLVNITRAWTPSWYNIDIRIYASPSDNAEAIRQAIISNLWYYFGQGVSLQWTGDTTETVDQTGHTIITDTAIDQTRQSQQPSLWQQLFGNSSAIDASGKILGLSVGTIALIGIGYIFLTQRKR